LLTVGVATDLVSCNKKIDELASDSGLLATQRDV